MAEKQKTIIGWAEWCVLPTLDLPAVKAKIDTGAKTSALHAYDIKTFSKEERIFVEFKIHPLQGDNKFYKTCTAPLKETRIITSSNGERERRHVIETPVLLGDISVSAEITLTSRHNMAFRMLLGRDALKKGKVLINARKSYLLGRIKKPEDLYEINDV